MEAARDNGEEILEAGAPSEAGTFLCTDCSLPISFDRAESFPRCPGCGGERFRRASMFESGFEQPTLTDMPALETEPDEGWLARLRESVGAPGAYLAFFAAGRTHLVELKDGWSRIGRSRSAHIRLDDPTVSRRHAVVVRTPEGELSALDDRSLNGIMVNGEAVDWCHVRDGDRIQIGRYTLHVIESGGDTAEP